jgi:hypothetical protein
MVVHVHAGVWPYVTLINVHGEPTGSTYPHNEAVEEFPVFQNYSQEPQQNLHVHVHN